MDLFQGEILSAGPVNVHSKIGQLVGEQYFNATTLHPFVGTRGKNDETRE